MAEGVRVSDVVEELKEHGPGLEPPTEKTVRLAGKEIVVRPMSLGDIRRLPEAFGDVFTSWAVWAKDKTAMTPDAFIKAFLGRGKGLARLLAALAGLEESELERASIAEVVGYVRAWFEVNDLGVIHADFFGIKEALEKAGLLELFKRIVEKPSQK